MRRQWGAQAVADMLQEIASNLNQSNPTTSHASPPSDCESIGRTTRTATLRASDATGARIANDATRTFDSVEANEMNSQNGDIP